MTSVAAGSPAQTALGGSQAPDGSGAVRGGDDRAPLPLLRAPGARRRRRRLGTAFRLALFHAAVLAVVLGVVVAALVHQFSTSYEALAANGLADELRAYSAAVARAGPTESLLDTTVRYLQSRSLPAGTVVVVALAPSHVVATPGAAPLRDDPQAARWLRRPPAASLVRTTRVGAKDVELLAAPIRSGHQTLGTFLAATDLSALRAQRTRVLNLSIAEAAVALLAGVLSSYLLLRRLLRTVGRITTTAEQIGRDDLGRRLGDQGTDDEVGQLATTFDAMLDRVDASMTAQRRLLSDVSHQLRTPLTVARGHLEVLERTGGLEDPRRAGETVGLVIDELDHMRALVERLLLLGRALEPDFAVLEPVDLRALLGDVHHAASVLAPRAWSLGPVPDVVVRADGPKLRGALLNLVDNAVKATGAGDPIAFVTSVDPVTGELSLAVEDAGPGIAPAERDAVLGRFARTGSWGDDGTGLGLAIANAVADAHGGRVEVGASRLGGARVAIVLPGRLLVTAGEA